LRHRFLSALAILLLASTIFAQNNPVPSSPAAPQEESQVRFAYGGDVAQIPAQFVSNLVYLPVSVNQGEPSLFLLDSTSATSSIDPKRAGALGLVEGTDSVLVGNAVLTLPGVQWQLPSLNLVRRDQLVAQTGRAYQGTLGLDFLSRVVLGIDYSRRAVQIYAPSAYIPPSTRTPIQAVKWSGGLPYVACRFSVRGERASIAPFLVASAQPAGIVFRDKYVSGRGKTFEHLKTVPGMYGAEAQELPASFGRVAMFAIEKLELPNLVAVFPHGAVENETDSSAAGLIGAAYLRRFTLVFDLPHEQIIFEPNIHYVDRDDVGMSGLSILARGANHKTFEVTFVDPGSPAAQAGMHVGDIIEGVNDEAAADLTLEEVEDLFRQFETRYKVLIEREGKSITVNFQTRRLI
jgi:hypothetical protein